jgi:hypothetical protein
MKRDFRFSEEGDLVLGSPRINEFGELLYIDMMGEVTTDDAEGELIRDIPTQVSYLSEKQVILNRLKTDNPDWLLHPEVGADLAELKGLPNTRETGKLAIELVERCLTEDGFLSRNDIQVRPVPISSDEILIHISIARNANNLVIPVLYNLEHGLLTNYEVKP